MYLMTCTRPDLAAAIGIFSRFMSNPGKEHWEGVKRILRYIRFTADFKLTFWRQKKLKIRGYVDSDWAGCLDTRRSTTGYVFTLGNTAVSWSSKRQQCVTVSSCEAEYVAAGIATREALWISEFLDELGEPDQRPVKIFCDSQSALNLIRNPVNHEGSKHIHVQHHHIREQYQIGEIKMEYIPTKQQPADALTKAVNRETLERCRTAVGVQE
jgi:hypothetical protein